MKSRIAVIIAGIGILTIAGAGWSAPTNTTKVTNTKATNAAVKTVGGVDERVAEAWQKNMLYGIAAQRSKVIQTVERMKAKEYYYLIESAFTNDKNEDVRSTATYSLIMLKVSNETLWMKALANETKTEMLRKIAYGIGELKIAKAGPQLFTMLTNRITNPKENSLSAAILYSLGQIKYKPASGYVLTVITNIQIDSQVRGAAANAIADIGTKEEVNSLTNLLNNAGEDKEIRMYCAYALGKSTFPEMVPVLMPYVENEKEDINIRLYAIAGLGFIKDAAVTTKLMDWTKLDNTRVRIEAIRSLGKLKDDKAKELLIFKARSDPDFGVQKEAKIALQNYGIYFDTKGMTVDSNAMKTISTNKSVTNK